eukprot:TRINITY_DN29916_c0_g1_i1.p1 TRINITY_DN29916_c0_g1~~TRINITY_DN29916_c0_g1_i1.p1  ORF type:complete len:877 (-),score=133.03 TRINITY_DN29916_c0_g1_i1:85-2715(-)
MAATSMPMGSPARSPGPPIWGSSPRAGSPLAILHDAKEFLASSPALPPRPRPCLDPQKTPFGGERGMASGPLTDSRDALPGMRLPALTMEAFTAMKRREGLESRSSDPGASRCSSLRHHKKRHQHDPGSGSASAPVSRGQEVAETLTMGFWPLETPQTAPEPVRVSHSPLMRPHSLVNLGGTTPIRYGSTGTLQGASGRRCDKPPKPSRQSSRRRLKDDSPNATPVASPLELGDEFSPMQASPSLRAPLSTASTAARTLSRQRNSADSYSPMMSEVRSRPTSSSSVGRSAAGYPEASPIAAPESRGCFAMSPSRTVVSAEGQRSASRSRRGGPRRAGSTTDLHRLPSKDSTPGRAVDIMPRQLVPDLLYAMESARGPRSRAPTELELESVCDPNTPAGGVFSLEAATSTESTKHPSTSSSAAPRDGNGYACAPEVAGGPAEASHAAHAAEACTAGAELQRNKAVEGASSASPGAMPYRNDTECSDRSPVAAEDKKEDEKQDPPKSAREVNSIFGDETEDILEASYGWDAGGSEPASLAGSMRSGLKADRKNSLLLSNLSISRGPRGGVTALSVSSKNLAAEVGKARTDGTPALTETLSSPDAVQGSNFSWVKGEVIGHGCLGVVFTALNQRTGQIFAVKQVRIDDRDKADVKFRKSLENEIEIYKELKHPKIVSYLGHDNINGNLYIYLEYMPGGSITQVLSQFGAFDESLIATYTLDLLQGLEYLHCLDPVVLHRDIKGANILVSLESRVKLSDFGCSKKAADTLSQSLRGSIPWMAPEVIQQTGYGRRSDVWSLGCVVIEMATARHPWGSLDNPVAAMMKIGMSKETPPLPDSVSDVCKDFIKQCTQRDKTLRPTASMLLQHPFVSALDRADDC